MKASRQTRKMADTTPVKTNPAELTLDKPAVATFRSEEVFAVVPGAELSPTSVFDRREAPVVSPAGEEVVAVRRPYARSRSKSPRTSRSMLTANSSCGARSVVPRVCRAAAKSPSAISKMIRRVRIIDVQFEIDQ
jgi:hypothetical protein